LGAVVLSLNASEAFITMKALGWGPGHAP
jgi:hypothetical protein